MGSAASKPTERVDSPFDDEKQMVSSFSSLRLVPSGPKSSDGSLSLNNLATWESTASADPKIQLSRTILSHTNIRAALTSRDAYIADRHVFNHEIEFKTSPVTNQRNSGRCWLFATTNILRYDVMKKLKLKEFELSQVCRILLIAAAIIWHCTILVAQRDCR
jgi:bleomycin hydrolase